MLVACSSTALGLKRAISLHAVCDAQEQLGQLIAKHVGLIANEDVALAKAFSAFIKDEDTRLRG